MLIKLPNELKGTPAIEIGCGIGESTQILSLFFSPVYVVDSFVDTRSKSLKINQLESFGLRLSGRNVILVAMDSKDAILHTPQRVSFVYIDGAHDFNSVQEDIRNYLPKVFNGGYIGGHDYQNKDNPEVEHAVNGMIGKPDTIFIDTSWLKRV